MYILRKFRRSVNALFLLRNNALRNIHCGKRCFILGNGPSLKHYDLKKLQREWVFACNWFILHKECARFRHLYYVCADPFFWQGGALLSEIKKFLLKHPLIEYFFEINRGGRTFMRDSALRKRALSHFIAIDQQMPAWEGNFHWDLTKPLCWTWTTLLDICLPVAIYMGFKKVYFIGFDNNYKISNESKVNDYFYCIEATPSVNIQHHSQQKLFREKQMRQTKVIDSARTIADAINGSGVEVYLDRMFSTIDAFFSFEFDGLF